MSTLKTNKIQHLTSGFNNVVQFVDGAGTENGRLCRAFVNFNGTSTVAIRANFNVSSITDNGTGDYTVNFSNAMADANYSVTGLHQFDQTNSTTGMGVFLAIARHTTALSTGSVRVLGNVGNAVTLYDGTTITVTVNR